MRHVRLQAVEHIARMASRLAAPGGTQDAVEHLLLHAVLCANAQQVAHPDRGDAQRKPHQNEGCHHGHRSEDAALCGMRGHVDGVLNGPNRPERYRHVAQSDEGVEERLATVATPGMPKPPSDHRRWILTVGLLQLAAGESVEDSRYFPRYTHGAIGYVIFAPLLYCLGSAPHISFSRRVLK